MIGKALAASMLAAKYKQDSGFGSDFKQGLTNAMRSITGAPRLVALDAVHTILTAEPRVEAAPLDIDLDALEGENGVFTAAGDSEVTIRVSENPTTGYRWTVDSEDCGVRLKQTSSEWSQEASAGIGAGGERVWTFETPTPEENYIRGLPCDLKFHLSRSWENDAIQSKQLRITVN